jgi:hypothetical protein
MAAELTDAVKAELTRHRMSASVKTPLWINCECGHATIWYLGKENASTAFGAHIAREVWKNVELPVVESAEHLASLTADSIVINAKGQALQPRTENAGPDNDEEIFKTRGELRILAGGPKSSEG